MRYSWNGFDPDKVGSWMSLHSKLVKHINNQDGKRCHAYLTIVDKHWPGKNDGSFTNCPIDRRILRDAVNLANKWITSL